MTNRRDFLRLCGAGGLSLLLANSCAGGSNRKPNVVFVLVDDLGWMDLGYQGSPSYQTPNIDRLAGSAVRFTDAYASCPVCSPTRASIMTGKYPARLDITDWISGLDPKDQKLLGPQDQHRLPLSETTIAEALRSNGYKTFFAGKWHLGEEGYFPEDQGFDINKGGLRRGGYYGPDGEYLPDRLTDESIRFMEQNREDPFFLFLSFYTVHTPIQPSKRHIEENKNRVASLTHPGPPSIAERNGITKLWQDNADYASMVQAMDENVGRLLSKLDEFGLTDNTMVVFTSDNGGLSTLNKEREANIPTSNVPLRAGKGWCYEGGIRVPLIISMPGVAKPGSTCDIPVTSCDLYPTILELAGIEAMPRQHIDGLSLASLVKGGEALERAAIYWHYPHYHGSMWAPGAAIRVGDWKLIEFYEEETSELYNLRDDIGEKRDLSNTNPEKARELLDLLHRWQKDIGARFPEPNPNFETKRSPPGD